MAMLADIFTAFPRFWSGTFIEVLTVLAPLSSIYPFPRLWAGTFIEASGGDEDPGDRGIFPRLRVGNLHCDSGYESGSCTRVA